MSGFLCPHCGKETAIFGTGGGKRMAEDLEVPFLGTIPIDPEFVSNSDAGKAFIDAKADGACTKMINQIIEKLM